jgi:Fe-S cluster assembly protein SufD
MRSASERVSLAGADTPDRAIDALNAAFVRDGYALSIADNATIETPLELVFMRSTGGAMSHARAHVAVGKGADVTIVERHISPDGQASQSSAVTNYAVGEGASLVLAAHAE